MGGGGGGIPPPTTLPPARSLSSLGLGRFAPSQTLPLNNYTMAYFQFHTSDYDIVHVVKSKFPS